MPDKILHKRNLTTGNVPTTSSLDPGELAINVADGKLFLRQSGSIANRIVTVGESASFAATSSAALLDLATGDTRSYALTMVLSSSVAPPAFTSPRNPSPLAVRNELVFNGNTGVLQTTASVALTASIATTASHALEANTVLPLGGNKLSGFISYVISTGSMQYVRAHHTLNIDIPIGGASSTVNLTGSLVATNITSSLQGTASFATTASQAVSSSFANTATSSSYAVTASYLANYIAPFPYTGSAQILGSLGITGSLSNGNNAIASGNYSHAEGTATTAANDSAHAEGSGTTANGQASHAEGSNTAANGQYSHAEGTNTSANGYSTHAEGWSTIANGAYSHAEGISAVANSEGSHAEGYTAETLGNYSHAEGSGTKTVGMYSHAEGVFSITGYRVYSCSINLGVVEIDALQGDLTNTFYDGSVIYFGDISNIGANIFTGIVTASFYNGTLTTFQLLNDYGTTISSAGIIDKDGPILYQLGGYGAHAEGAATVAIGDFSHAEGDSTATYGAYSHAEGTGLTIADYSHAEGSGYTYGAYSHAEGTGLTIANYSHAEGSGTAGHAAYQTINIAAGVITFPAYYGDLTAIFAPGIKIYVNDKTQSAVLIHEVASSLLNGSNETEVTLVDTAYDPNFGFHVGLVGNSQPTYADVRIGDYSHAEGTATTTLGEASHADGYYTTTHGYFQTVTGQYNAPVQVSSSFVIGNGDSSTPSNLLVAYGDTVQITGSIDVRDKLGAQAIDSTNRTLLDENGNASVVWTTQRTLEHDNGAVLDWANQTLNDYDTLQSVDWNNRQLIQSDGTTVTLDWENGIFSGSATTSETASYVNPLTQDVQLTGSLTISGSTTQIGSNNLLGQTNLSGSIILSGSVNALANITLGGTLRLDPAQDPGNTNATASFLFTSASNTEQGYDLYYRQDGNLVKFKWIEGGISSGLLYGGIISASGTTIYVSSGSGVILNANATPSKEINPIFTYVTWPNYSAPATYLTSSQNTYLYVDNLGVVHQQTGYFDQTQYEEAIPLGRVTHANYATITGIGSNVQTTYNSDTQQSDFIRAFGPIKVNGFTPSGIVGTLGISIGEGTAFNLGGFYSQNPNSPSHYTATPAVTASIIRAYRSGSEIRQDNNGGAFYTVIDPTKYDNGTGTLASVGGQFTIQRIFYNPVTKRAVIYYGQNKYSTLSSAITNLFTDSFTEGEFTGKSLVFAGYLIVNGGASDLSNAADAYFIQSGIFRNTAGGSSSTGTIAQTLDDLSDVTITTPVNGQALVYSAGIWENGTVTPPTYIRRSDYTTTGDPNVNYLYCGEAVAGSAESSLVWDISRLAISSSGATLTQTTSSAAWTNRYSYTYL